MANGLLYRWLLRPTDRRLWLSRIGKHCFPKTFSPRTLEQLPIMFDIGQQCWREAWEKLTAQNSECISRSGEVAIPRNQEQGPSNRFLSPTDCIGKLGSR